MKIRKEFLYIFIVTGMLLLFTDIGYSDNLRLEIGQGDDTYGRMLEKMSTDSYSVRSAIERDLQSQFPELFAKSRFKRLRYILGWTGLGPDFERKYIEEISVQGHDIRTAKLAQVVAQHYELDSKIAVFISLVHDYVALPFRHFATLGELGTQLRGMGYNAKEYIIRCLQEDGFDLSEVIINDLSHFDINEVGVLSREAKIAIACESVEGAVEDILFGLRFELFTFEEIPNSVLEVLHMKDIDAARLKKRIEGDFDNLVIELSSEAFFAENLSIDELVKKATEIKAICRKDLIVPRIFKVSNTEESIKEVNRLIMPIYNGFIRQYLENAKTQDILAAEKYAIEKLSFVTEEAVLLSNRRADVDILIRSVAAYMNQL